MRGIDSKALEGAQEISFDVEQTTRTLSKIADWKDSLRDRIADVTDRFETIGVNDGEYDSLLAEVEAFKAACKGVRA